MSFIAFASQDFDSFLYLFQSDEPLIHILTIDLLFNLMNKFCKNGSVYEDSMSFIKSTSELAEVDVTLQKTQKSAKNIDIGTKTKLLLIELLLCDAESSFSEENA